MVSTAKDSYGGEKRTGKVIRILNSCVALVHPAGERVPRPVPAQRRVELHPQQITFSSIAHDCGGKERTHGDNMVLEVLRDIARGGGPERRGLAPGRGVGLARSDVGGDGGAREVPDLDPGRRDGVRVDAAGWG